MAQQSRDHLRQRFENGDFPDQQDFIDLFDSFHHLAEDQYPQGAGDMTTAEYANGAPVGTVNKALELRRGNAYAQIKTNGDIELKTGLARLYLQTDGSFILKGDNGEILVSDEGMRLKSGKIIFEEDPIVWLAAKSSVTASPEEAQTGTRLLGFNPADGAANIFTLPALAIEPYADYATEQEFDAALAAGQILTGRYVRVYQGGYWDIRQVDAAPNTTYTLAVSVSGGNGGFTLDPDKGSYTVGEVVLITANPGPQQAFVKWEDESTQNPRIVTMDANKVLSGQFVPVQLDPTFSVAVDSQNTRRVTLTLDKTPQDFDTIEVNWDALNSEASQLYSSFPITYDYPSAGQKQIRLTLRKGENAEQTGISTITIQ